MKYNQTTSSAADSVQDETWEGYCFVENKGSISTAVSHLN